MESTSRWRGRASGSIRGGGGRARGGLHSSAPTRRGTRRSRRGCAGCGPAGRGPGGARCGPGGRRGGTREVRTPLVGAYQARNAAFAAELLGLLPDDLRPEWEAVARGLESVRWPGRLQVERVRGATWLFDVAHNPAGVASLAASLDAL